MFHTIRQLGLTLAISALLGFFLAVHARATLGPSVSTGAVSSMGSGTSTGSNPAGGVGAGSVTASYEVFGQGCAGSEGGEGFVLPQGLKTRPGDSATELALSDSGSRMQVLFAPSEVSEVKVFLGMSFRYDELLGNQEGRVHLRVKIGGCSHSVQTLNVHHGWDRNFDTGLIAVVFDAWVDLPVRPNHARDLAQFMPSIRFNRPIPYVPQAGCGLLIEVTCVENSGGKHFVDAVRQDPAQATVAASFGRAAHHYPTVVRPGFAPVLRMLSPMDTVAPPKLDAVGRPQLGRSFGVHVYDARAMSPGLLISGWSRSSFAGQELPMGIRDGSPCALLCSWDFVQPIHTDANGFAQELIRLPREPQLAGLRFYQQFLIFDPGTPQGFVLSNGGAGQVGDL
jgi:hypothetical protein